MIKSNMLSALIIGSLVSPAAYAANLNPIDTKKYISAQEYHNACFMPYFPMDYHKSQVVINSFNEAVDDYVGNNVGNKFPAPEVLYKQLQQTDEIVADELSEKLDNFFDFLKYHSAYNRYLKASIRCSTLYNKSSPTNASSNSYNKATLGFIDKFIDEFGDINSAIFDTKSLAKTKIIVETIIYDLSLQKVIQNSTISTKYTKFKEHFDIATAQAFGNYHPKDGTKFTCFVQDNDKPMPMKLLNIKNLYPPEALDKNIEGIVVAQLEIDKTGKIIDQKITASDPILVNDAIKAKILGSKFRPAIKNCQPYSADATVTIRFVLH